MSWAFCQIVLPGVVMGLISEFLLRYRTRLDACWKTFHLISQLGAFKTWNCNWDFRNVSALNSVWQRIEQDNLYVSISRIIGANVTVTHINWETHLSINCYSSEFYFFLCAENCHLRQTRIGISLDVLHFFAISKIFLIISSFSYDLAHEDTMMICIRHENLISAVGCALSEKPELWQT